MAPVCHPYHHGDLRTAFIEAGMLLARRGGANALSLRELARSVGVTPNAAYRHFPNHRALITAIATRAQDRLAQAMVVKMKVVGRSADPARRTVQRLRGAGLGYINFALSEPGWFDLAILNLDNAHDHCVAPYYLPLLDALDEMTNAGVLTHQQRQNAEWTCWSGIHGFAELATNGPLRAQSRKTIDKLAVTVVDTIISGVMLRHPQ